jgi:hypothetical protein
MSRNAAAFVLMCIASPLAAQSFEGTVTMNITSDNGTVRPISYMLKGGKLRFDPQGAGAAGQMSVIIDPASQHMMVIMPSRKMYMETDFGGAMAAAQQQVAGKNPSITRTGRMDTVAGYKCEHVMVTDDDGTSVDTCVSSELGGFRMPTASNPMAPQHEAGWVTQMGSGSFPLKVQKGGKTVMEVTSIEKKSLDATLFAAPEGFQSFSMPGMPRKPPQD